MLSGSTTWTRAADIPPFYCYFQPMPRNIEIKARIPAIEAIAPLAAAMADEGPVEIFQDDTFFRCDTGRRVIKQRTLFIVGRTRIHLDKVQGLGDFLELEVVLSDEDTLEGGTREAEQIMRQLGIEASQLIETAYVDLLAAQA